MPVFKFSNQSSTLHTGGAFTYLTIRCVNRPKRFLLRDLVWRSGIWSDCQASKNTEDMSDEAASGSRILFSCSVLRNMFMDWLGKRQASSSNFVCIIVTSGLLAPGCKRSSKARLAMDALWSRLKTAIEALKTWSRAIRWATCFR